ncbi:PHD finger protein At1g33420-like isoform X2 [Typha angustifolia]|uniref:PHD finger protein At1g33420-like isoform X2 n=1 Tax=Typha angustifolia TaxID=59011 RepID=UPI003C2FDD1F
MTVNGRPLKRAKRRVTADLYDFLTFPSAEGRPFGGPFRCAVLSFLSRHARLVPATVLSAAGESSQVLTWRICFRVGLSDGGSAVELDIVEEDVTRSRNVHCEQCKVVGWGGHPVCGKRYHFIIGSSKRPCGGCGLMVDLSELRCSLCNHDISSDNQDDWGYAQVENYSHLLHGVVHANGYGHLVRINGQEGGSQILTGCDLMDFWDRLCKLLQVRKVTVMDLSRKHDMEYRLLHAVSAGHSWFGDWGYRFGVGSFGITAETYRKAIDTLSSMPLSLFFGHARVPRSRLQNTIALYQSIADYQLITVRDLFCYVTGLLRSAHGQKHSETYAETSPEAIKRKPCHWPDDDVRRAEDIMIKVLRAADVSRWVSLRDLRGAASWSVGSPELLDHCLKSLGGRSTDDGLVVSVRCNAETSTLEFRLEAATNESKALDGQGLWRPSRDHLLRDLKFLYHAVLSPETMQYDKLRVTRESARSSAVTVLDCKHFIKHYDESNDWLLPDPFALNIWCHVELLDQPKSNVAPPPELLVLPATATVGDLKVEATKAFREIYPILQTFQVELLMDCKAASDTTQLKLLFGSSGTARVGGRCSGGRRRLGQFRMERGMAKWKVNCVCGANDDDGERMLACDACGVWRHTRCSGIQDFEDVPKKFVCRLCTRAHEPRGRSSRSSSLCKDSKLRGRREGEIFCTVTREGENRSLAAAG